MLARGTLAQQIVCTDPQYPGDRFSDYSSGRRGGFLGLFVICGRRGAGGSGRVGQERLGSRWCSEQTEQVVPVVGSVGSRALQAGMLTAQGSGGLVAGGIGVVAAQQGEVLQGMEPSGQAAGGAGGGDDETISGQAGRGQQDGGEGINRTLGEQDGGGRGGTAAQPEAAAIAAGTRSQPPLWNTATKHDNHPGDPVRTASRPRHHSDRSPSAAQVT